MAGRKFRFSLDAVLRLRRHEAEQAERALAQVARLRQDREAHLAAAEDALRALPDAAGLAGTPADFRRTAAARSEVMDVRAQARRALEAARQREGAARRALVEARRPEEALESLRERQEEAHRQAALRAEAGVLDEHATAAYCRQLRADA